MTTLIPNYVYPATPTQDTGFEIQLADSLANSLEEGQRAMAAMYAWRTVNFEMIEKLLSDPSYRVRKEAIRYAGRMGLYARLVEMGMAKYPTANERDGIGYECLIALCAIAANAKEEARVLATHLLTHGGWQLRNTAEQELYILNRE